MAGIPVRNFATLVGNFAAGVQGRAADLVDFSVGSVLRSVSEATADLTLWLQSVIVYVLTLTRAATSEKTDLDTWYADWFFTRLPAVPATGIATFSRFSADQDVLVPIGAEVATESGDLFFAVYADATNPAFDDDLGGYVLPAGTLDADVPVRATMPDGTLAASAWNVRAGQITQARTTITGVDTVLNGTPLTNGIDAESDPAFRARFRLYIDAFAKGTEAAIRLAIANLQQGVQVVIQQVPGLVTVTIDDGSGSVSTDLLGRARLAVDAVRAGGVWIDVQPATAIVTTVQMTVAIDPAYSVAGVQSRVTAALAAHINGRGLGKPLRYSHVESVAYGISGVTNVTAVLLNGAAADIVPAATQSVKAGALIVSPTP